MTFETPDYIIVGAGSAGSALASRLTEDGRTTVLLLEAGRASHPLSWLPVSFGLFIDHPGVNWRYRSRARGEYRTSTHPRAPWQAAWWVQRDQRPSVRPWPAA